MKLSSVEYLPQDDAVDFLQVVAKYKPCIMTIALNKEHLQVISSLQMDLCREDSTCVKASINLYFIQTRMKY